MKIVSLDEVPRTAVTMEGASRAWRQTPLSSADGAPTFAFRVFTLEPGGHTPYHAHPFEHLNYVIRGAGAIVDAEGRAHEFAEGDFAIVPPGEQHQYRNASPSEEFVMICAVPKAYE